MVCIDYLRFEIDFRQTNVAQKHVDMQILPPLSSFYLYPKLSLFFEKSMPASQSLNTNDNLEMKRGT